MYINNPKPRPKPLVLIIVDGLGLTTPNPGNAVTLAKTPNLNAFWKKYPHCNIRASGIYAGLPAGVNGNSEVGHMGIGAGKIVFQEIAKIDHEIDQKTFFTNPTFKSALEHIKNNNGKLHLMGLASPGKVHSSMKHLYACLEYCKKENIDGKKVFIHAFTDGRDVAPKSAERYLKEIEEAAKTIGIGQIASLVGRYWAMDRDNRWDRTQKAYELIVYGKGIQTENWQTAIQDSYKNQVTDEYLKPYVIIKNGQPLAAAAPGDAVIFFNYRADRAVQITKAFEDKEFKNWDRLKLENIFFAGFSNYEKGIPMNRAAEDTAVPGGEREMISKLFAEEIKKTAQFPKNQIFPPERVEYSLGRMIADANLAQLRITESEKFPHVTYFFNCRQSGAFNREDRIEVPSPKEVATYDLKPEMSAPELTETLIQKVNENKYDFITVNFAQTDMVAHTGNLTASIKAVEVADECLGRIIQTTLSKGGAAIITSDHGNVEELTNLLTGAIDTEHSTNPVPFIYASNDFGPMNLKEGMLADIAPTILAQLQIEIPSNMIGRNLLS